MESQSFAHGLIYKLHPSIILPISSHIPINICAHAHPVMTIMVLVKLHSNPSPHCMRDPFANAIRTNAHPTSSQAIVSNKVSLRASERVNEYVKSRHCPRFMPVYIANQLTNQLISHALTTEIATALLSLLKLKLFHICGRIFNCNK